MENLSRKFVFEKIMSTGTAPFTICYSKNDSEQVKRVGCMHMSNPINPEVTKPGHGIRAGIDYLTAYKTYNSLLYYDCVKNSFRKAKIDNIVSINVNGVEYKITG